MTTGPQNIPTPRYFFEYLNRLFGPFGADAFASPEDALLPVYYTDYRRDWDPNTFANPPFGMADACVDWAFSQAVSRGVKSTLILPALCSQRWARTCYAFGKIYQPRYRIFQGTMRDSAVVTFGHPVLPWCEEFERLPMFRLPIDEPFPRK